MFLPRKMPQLGVTLLIHVGLWWRPRIDRRTRGELSVGLSWCRVHRSQVEEGGHDCVLRAATRLPGLSAPLTGSGILSRQGADE
jgi:hypothetical protein